MLLCSRLEKSRSDQSDFDLEISQSEARGFDFMISQSEAHKIRGCPRLTSFTPLEIGDDWGPPGPSSVQSNTSPKDTSGLPPTWASPSPSGPACSPVLQSSTVLGSVTYFLKRQRPRVTSVYHGTLVSTGADIGVHTEAEGLIPSVMEFIKTVRSSRHPASPTAGEGFPSPGTGGRPGCMLDACLEDCLSTDNHPSSTSLDEDDTCKWGEGEGD